MINRRSRLLTLVIILVLILSACSKDKSAEEYLQDGQKHLESGDLPKAITSLNKALEKDPGLAEAHRLLGEALGHSERWPEAVTQFEAYKALEKENAAAYFLLGQAYAQTDDLDKAAASFADGVRLDPSFLESHKEDFAEVANDILQAGQEALAAGDLATAADLLTIVAPLVPGKGEVFLSLGEAHLEADDIVSALTAFANAINLSPELAAEHADRIDALAQQGLEMGQAALDARDLGKAAQIIEAVTMLLPDEARAHFLLGNVYNETNEPSKLEQAIEEYKTVLRLEPTSSSAHTNMGVVYYKLGDLETAIQEYNAALQIEPDDAETHYLLGAAYVQMNQLEASKTEFETALRANDQLAPAYIGLGNVYLLQGELESALDVLQQATALAPNSPEAFFALGQIYIQLGNVPEAQTALERVLSLNPAPPWREQTERLLESLNSP